MHSINLAQFYSHTFTLLSLYAVLHVCVCILFEMMWWNLAWIFLIVIMQITNSPVKKCVFSFIRIWSDHHWLIMWEECNGFGNTSRLLLLLFGYENYYCSAVSSDLVICSSILYLTNLVYIFLFCHPSLLTVCMHAYLHIMHCNIANKEMQKDVGQFMWLLNIL